MSARQGLVTVALCGLLALPDGASAQQRAADGDATLNAEGLPAVFDVFAACAIDPATGQSGAAVTTRVPFVGRAVPLRARRRRRRLHAGVHGRRVRAARTRSAREGRRAAGGAVVSCWPTIAARDRARSASST